MAAVTEKSQQPADLLEGIQEGAQRHIRQWCGMCDEFKEVTLQAVLAWQPSDLALEQHRRTMKMFLRMTRLLHAEVADPDFPDRSLAAELAFRIRQLEELWETIHNPLPDDEADRLLHAAFP